MTLPAPRTVTRRDLARFDRRIGSPAALRILRGRLSRWQMVRFVARFALASLRDPLRRAPTEGWPADREPLVRHQLRAAVRLDDATRGLLPEAQRLALLREVIGETGALFLEFALALPTREQWGGASAPDRRAFARGTADTLFNARIEAIDVGDDRLGFDVCACRFAQLCRALGREHLASMFCAADSVYFDRATSPIALRRTQTLAEGGSACDFRFEYR